MLKIPKEMEGRRLDILVAGISTLEVKVTKITETEIIAEHDDGEEVHIDPEAVRVWWIPRVRVVSEEAKAKRKATIARKKQSDDPKP